MPQIARFSLVALDCPDPVALGRFYSALTGWPFEDGETGDDPAPDDPGDWFQLRSPHGATIAFQRVPDHRPPVWPSAEHPQQLHIDFDVADLDEGERAVLALGARKAEVQPGTTFRVYLDPAGHPFCLVLDEGVHLDA